MSIFRNCHKDKMKSSHLRQNCTELLYWPANLKYFAHFLFQDWSYLLFSPQIFPCLCPDFLIDIIFHGPNAFKFVTVQFCKRNKDSTCTCTVFHWCAVAEKVWRAKQPDFGITGFWHPWIWCDRKFYINRTENWADIETGQWGWLCQLNFRCILLNPKHTNLMGIGFYNFSWSCMKT